MMIIKNTTYIFLARVFNAVLLFLLFVVISRKLGVELLGVYSFVYTVVLTGTFFANFGLDVLMVREVSRDNKLGDVYLSNILGLKIIISSLIISVICLINHFFMPGNIASELLWSYCMVIMFNSLSQIFWYYGDSFEKLEYHSMLWVVSNCLKAGFGIPIVIYAKRIDLLIYALILAEFLSLIISLFVVEKRFHCVLISFNIDFHKKLLIKAYPIGVGMILGALYFRVDIIMLWWMKGKEYVGLYSAPCKIIEGFTLFPGSIMLAAFPSMSKNFDFSKNIYWTNVKKIIVVLALSGGFIAACLAFYAEEIILLFYGGEYMMSTPILRLLSIALFLIFINWFLSYVLISGGKELYNMICLAVMTMLNIAMNVFFIPKYGHIGAAWATVISEMILICLFSFKVLKIRRIKPAFQRNLCL